MRQSLKNFMLVSLLGLAGCAGQALGNDSAPKGWFIAGENPSAYEVGTDQMVKYQGKASGFIHSKQPQTKGFGTLMQSFEPQSYQGKRVRLSGYIKTENVLDEKAWAGLWMRVDKEEESVSFDNMQDRPIRGNQHWQRYQIVLHVPKGATNLSFGVLLAGSGQVWLDDVQLELVDDSVPLTKPSPKQQSQPENTNFEG